MIDIHLYGKLRRRLRHPDAASGAVRVRPEPGETVAGLLRRMELPEEEIYTIFLNRKLLAAKSGMACWIGYRAAGPDPLDWDLNVPVESGDRLGIFGRDMALLVI